MKPQTPINLKKLIPTLGLKQASIARAVGVSTGTFADIVNWNKWPRRNHEQVKERICLALRTCGASLSQINTAFDLPTAAKQNAQGSSLERLNEASPNPEGYDMLLRKQTLTPAARKQFALFRDPFIDDVQAADDVFLTPDIRYVRESMWTTAKHGGLLAVVGESGAGKSTLRRDFIDRIQREQVSIIVAEPYILAMEESDIKGKTLKAASIAEAIISAVNPLEKPKRSAEARFKQLHQLLKDSHRSGNKHVLIIEEAHCLPTATLKHLKRFFELEDGFKKLLAIILIGQPELKMKLSDKNTEVREVVQRCEIAELAPLDNHLEEFLKFKFERVGSNLDKVFEAGAIDALRAKLTFNQPVATRGRAYTSHATTSLLYPLAVANVVTAAMNMAASIGAPMVSSDVLKEV